MSGEIRRTRSTKFCDRLRAVHGRRRVVRVVQEDHARAANGREHFLEVDPELRVDLHLVHRMAEAAAEARAVLERRRARHQRTERRRERADRRLEDLLRAGAQHDVLGLGLVQRRDRLDELAFVRRAVERITSRFGEFAEDRVEHRLAGAQRILVAADADFLDALRGRRATLTSRALRAASAAAAATTLATASTGAARAARLCLCPVAPALRRDSLRDRERDRSALIAERSSAPTILKNPRRDTGMAVLLRDQLA